MLVIFVGHDVGAAEGWNGFFSDRGFSIRYPASWIVHNPFHDNSSLLILSGRGGAEGVVIKRGQGAIEVRKRTDGSFAEIVRRSLNRETGSRGKPLSQTTQDLPATPACKRLKEIVTVDYDGAWPEDVPKGTHLTPKHFAEYLCDAGAMTVSLLEQNYVDDKRQAEYERIAGQMIRTLRLTQ